MGNWVTACCQFLSTGVPVLWFNGPPSGVNMNRRLLRHLTIPVAPISVLLLAVGVWAAWRVQHLQGRVSREWRENVSALRAAEEVGILVRSLRTPPGAFWRPGGPRSVSARVRVLGADR